MFAIRSLRRKGEPTRQRLEHLLDIALTTRFPVAIRSSCVSTDRNNQRCLFNFRGFAMERSLVGAWTAVALFVFAFAPITAVAAGDKSPEATRAEHMQRWAADHEAMMDARLGGMKAALKLTPNQYPLWEAFETAVRTGAKGRMDDMRQMMENSDRMSPDERMDMMAGHMARRADELKTIAKSAKPFYGSLDDAQKRSFELLGREMLMASTGPMWEELGGDAGGTWVPGHWNE
jgi:hypothetical protein